MLYLVVTGAIVGTLSGMIGVGGCFIMIPIQFFVLQAMGIGADLAIKIAFASNLMVVAPTALSGALAHNKKGAVLWGPGIYLGISGAIGAVIGATLASQYIPGSVLKVGFGYAIVISAIRMLTAKPVSVDKEPTQNKLAYIGWGLPLGIVSGIIGIGGGVLIIPVMTLILNFKMHKAVGTSTLLMLFTALGGALSYMVNGLGVSGLPPYSTGYVNWLQFLLLGCTSIPMAVVGARIAHLVSAKKLKYVFSIVVIIMGLKMIGLY